MDGSGSPPFPLPLQLVGKSPPQISETRLRMGWRSPVFVVSGSRYPLRSLSFSRFSPYIPRSYSTPVKPTSTHQFAEVSVAFPVTLAGRLPQCTLTELYHSSGDCESPCDLHRSLSTLHSYCFTILHTHLMLWKFVGNAVPSAIHLWLS